MRKHLLNSVVTVFLVMVVAVSAWAGNVDTYGIGAKNTAMGGAVSAYADDPFAIYYNFDGHIAIVMAVLDCRRNPRSIRGTLGARGSKPKT